jgi:Ca2+-binding RTX toxin-like protein
VRPRLVRWFLLMALPAVLLPVVPPPAPSAEVAAAPPRALTGASAATRAGLLESSTDDPIIGAAGGTIRIDDSSDPLYGTEVTVPPGALDQTVTFSLTVLTQGDLTAALGEGLSATDRFRGGITIQTNPTVSLRLSLGVTLPSSGGARRGDQLLVGQILGLDPGHPPAFVYRGLASLGSLEFSVPSLGSYAVVSPARPMVIANGRYLTSSDAPIQDGIVQSTAYPLFTAVTDQAGAFSLPAGRPSEYTLLVARLATTTAGLGVLGTVLPQPSRPSPDFDVIAGNVELRNPEDLKPCREPIEFGDIVSSDQPEPVNGRFRLVVGGESIATRLKIPSGIFGGNPPPSSPNIIHAILSGNQRVSTSRFTIEPPPVASVRTNGDALHGVSAGSTIESATATIVRAEQSQRVLRLCKTTAFGFRPVDVAPALAIDSSAPPVGEVGVGYNGTLTARGGWPGYTWTWSGLPAGLQFTTAGDRAEITGTPRDAGKFTVSVTVSDSNTPMTSTSADIEIEIKPPGPQPPSSCDGAVPTIVGTEGPDFLSGTPGPDVIFGLGGDDGIEAGEGNDVICGGGGNDTLQDAPGNDYVDGGDGNDVIGSAGKQENSFADGPDTFRGGSGIDMVYYYDRIAGVTASLDGSPNDGEPGEGDTISTDVENLGGGQGDDHLIGDSRDNILNGFLGGDEIQGGDGDDVLYGWEGKDTLLGQAGQDGAVGGPGDDFVDGGDGDDSLLFGDQGSDIILGGSGNDGIYVDDFTVENDVANGGSDTDQCKIDIQIVEPSPRQDSTVDCEEIIWNRVF